MAQRKVKNSEKSPGDNVLPDQFQTVTAILPSDWCQKTFVFFNSAFELYEELWRSRRVLSTQPMAVRPTEA